MPPAAGFAIPFGAMPAADANSQLLILQQQQQQMVLAAAANPFGCSPFPPGAFFPGLMPLPGLMGMSDAPQLLGMTSGAPAGQLQALGQQLVQLGVQLGSAISAVRTGGCCWWWPRACQAGLARSKIYEYTFTMHLLQPHVASQQQGHRMQLPSYCTRCGTTRYVPLCLHPCSQP